MRAVNLRYGPTALLIFRRKSYSGFLRSKKNQSTTHGFEPVNLGSSGEYDKHGTTGVDVSDTMQSCQPQSNIEKVKEMYIKSKEIL